MRNINIAVRRVRFEQLVAVYRRLEATRDHEPVVPNALPERLWSKAELNRFSS